VEPLAIDGAWVHTPVVHRDDRGVFMEWLRGAEFAASVGHRLGLAQANMSVSRRGVVRGIHYADVPPGQAKYVTCVRGAALDIVVDIRVGSPTFGQWEAVRLDEEDRRAVYLSEGLGHGFCALTDDATMAYLCSTPYVAEREHGVDPLDPEIGIEWPADIEPILSGKDAEAPGLSAARDAGMLPSYDECRRYVAALD
jgi:dTDP-4-dehydrorhamnose 3,5-epimerase